ncbi:MAG TPA: DUF5990 family protein [Gemmatimonas sp.]|nr:DUF5990 family protein [Gemmatimonas sp.]
MSDSARVTLRLIIRNPVPGVALRVQRGRDGLLAPASVTADAVTFEFSLEVKPGADGSASLRGLEVQGPPSARFVYVTVGTRAGQFDSPWDRRAKVPLNGIGPAHFAALSQRPGTMFVATIEGRSRDGGPACASVPLLGDGWSMITR